MTPRDLGHHRPHRQCLLENPSFLVRRPPTTTPRPREHLDPTRDARLRLKLMVKHIHVPIPNQRSESATSHVIEEGAVRTALTVNRLGRAEIETPTALDLSDFTLRCRFEIARWWTDHFDDLSLTTT